MCAANDDNNGTIADVEKKMNMNNSHTTGPTTTNSEEEQPNGCEKIGNVIDHGIRNMFYQLGLFVAFRPKTTIALSIVFALVCAAGNVMMESESRPEELWVPQGTRAEREETSYLQYYDSTSRVETMIISDGSTNNGNVLTEESIEAALLLQQEIFTTKSTYDGTTYVFEDLCTKAGGSCSSSYTGVCSCLMNSILKQWNYDVTTFRNDTDFMATLQSYGTRDDLDAALGDAVFDDDDGTLISAKAFSITYFLQDRSYVENGNEVDPINEEWEKVAFLDVLEKQDDTEIEVVYFSTRSFSDEFGEAIGGDLVLVQVSYLVVFLFLGASLGKIKCGPGSRWSMSIAAVVMIGLSTAAGFGVSSLLGLFFGPVHSLLPFILLGIGVDDAFVIVNAFDRERKVPRKQEDDETLVERCAQGLGRAGASVTVTSMTDLVAFAISSSSSLPALASFCAYASICITFLWIFASTFFTACLVLDETRQRGNRRDCLMCCLQRGGNNNDEADNQEMTEQDLHDNDEGYISTYFRKYHAPAILSKPGKVIVLTVFSGLIAFGCYGATQLSVENTEREFIPADSYINDYVADADEYFPSDGTSYFIFFEETEANIGNGIYDKRTELAQLDDRLAGKSTSPPFIAEPVSEDAYRNVMTGLEAYLQTAGTDAIGGAEMGSDGWPATQQGFVDTVEAYVVIGAPGSTYSQDVVMVTDVETNSTRLESIRVEGEYVRLTKEKRGETIADSDKQIEAMDATREMVDSWTDLPPAEVYSPIFLGVEGFKIIRKELFSNVGLAILSVGIIVLFTVASFVTAFLITMNVAFCLVEILGFMWAIGIAIDSVSVINIVLAVGLSVDYSAHVGHTFMVKGGSDWNRRTTETLADMGAAVLSGATSTFLAVAVLLGSSSYVFAILSTQFALTVVLGACHGLILLPVLLSLFGPKAFAGSENTDQEAAFPVTNADKTSPPEEISAEDASEEEIKSKPAGVPDEDDVLEV